MKNKMNVMCGVMCVAIVLCVGGCQIGDNDIKVNSNDSDTAKTTSSAKVSIAGEDTVGVGEQITLTAARTPVDNSINFLWSSSDQSVATVDNGVVTGIGQGTAIITVSTDEDVPVTATKTIRVTAPAIDYTNYITGNRSITVRNNTSKNLVAFKGNPSAANLISGIPASATNHGLKLDKTLFANSTDFILFVVTEEDYKANANNLELLSNKPFTRLYAYYNDNANNNNMVYPISSKLGGNCHIILNNMTSYNVELRRDGIDGETLGYSAANTVNTTFAVDADEYYLFPVFRKFDKSSGEIITAYPKYISGDSIGEAVVNIFDLNTSTPNVELNAKDWIKDIKFAPSAAYLRIKNQSANGVSLYKGSLSTALTTSTGGAIINTGSEMTFEVKMKRKSDVNQEYNEYEEETDYRIGNKVNSGKYIISGDTSPSGKFAFYAGKMYTVIVTGTGTGINIDTSWMDTSTDVLF
ncbi:MAG: Ig-like domain-containing protein [Spirochaetales bacterium]|nr:Ig-like domain-containing protein [Spirochaetales bacterium]